MGKSTLSSVVQYVEPNDPNKQQWLSLGASIVVAALSGIGYAYGSFNPAIKTILGFNQADITFLGSAGHVGMFLGVFTGSFYDRMGSRPTLVVGSLVSAIFYFLMYLQLSLQIGASTSSLSLFYFIANVGNSFRVSSSVAVCIKNFPHTQRGKVVGLSKGYFALGASIYSQMYTALFNDRVDMFFLFLTLEAIVFMFLCFPYYVDIPYETKPATENLSEITLVEKARKELAIGKQLNKWYIMTFILTAVLTTFSVCQRTYEHGAWNVILCYLGLAGICIAIVLLGNMQLPVEPLDLHNDPEAGECSTAKNNFVACVTPVSIVPSNNSNCPVKPKQKTVDNGKPAPITTSNMDVVVNASGVLSPTATVKDLPLFKAIRKPTFWVLFIIFFVLAGCALVLMSNIAQLKYSLMKTSHAYLEVTIMGVGSLSGRMIVGFVSDMYKKTIPREGFLIGVSAVMTFAMGILCFNTSGGILPACILASTAYGGVFCLMPSLVADYYGSKYYAGNYGAIDLAPASATFAYATGIVNIFYKDVKVGKVIMNCYGSSCFANTFIICFFSGIVGIAASLVLLKIRPRK